MRCEDVLGFWWGWVREILEERPQKWILHVCLDAKGIFVGWLAFGFCEDVFWGFYLESKRQPCGRGHVGLSPKTRILGFGFMPFGGCQASTAPAVVALDRAAVHRQALFRALVRLCLRWER